MKLGGTPLARALEWVDPMERALGTAEITTYGLLAGNYDEFEFRTRFWRVLEGLVELSAEQCLVLDIDPYKLGSPITHSIEELITLGLFVGTDKPSSAFTSTECRGCSAQVHAESERSTEGGPRLTAPTFSRIPKNLP